MDEIDLQKLCEQLSLEFFSKPFLHTITYNKRLRSTGGRYLLQTGAIEINPKVQANLGYDALVGVIKHELCHYHLHQEGKGYRHRDADFKKLLKKVDGLRYVDRMEPPKYLYQCQQCHLLIPRMRKLDTNKYRCGRCLHSLTLLSTN